MGRFCRTDPERLLADVAERSADNFVVEVELRAGEDLVVFGVQVTGEAELERAAQR